MENILVTGGCGFIGSNLIEHLLKEYKEVEKIVVLDNMFTGKEENKVDHKKVIYIESPTWDIDKFFSDKEGLFDTVFHFGEYSRIVKSFNDSKYVMKTNLHGTTCILEKCRKWKAKLIYSASSSKFGNDGKDENLSPYAWVKSKMVELIKNYNKWYDLQYEICYFFNVYGPKQIMKGDYSTVIGIFERQYKNNEPLSVVEPGTQYRDFTHVYDVVEGVIKSVNMNMNREWMLRSGVNYKIIDVAKMFTDNIIMLPERRGERFTSEEFNNDTEEVLNWGPKYKLEEYIKNKL
ncbi:NAD-dependent epimerase/dehydratase family protein [bacterium]|nr:NAD-dependent epimerase/dehydratase family protein [bacterium]